MRLLRMSVLTRTFFYSRVCVYTFVARMCVCVCFAFLYVYRLSVPVAFVGVSGGGVYNSRGQRRRSCVYKRDSNVRERSRVEHVRFG